MRFSTIFTALFYPYMAHEWTAQNLDFVSSLVALILIERHCSQNKGSFKKSEERLSDFKERCAQLCHILQNMTDILPKGSALVIWSSQKNGSRWKYSVDVYTGNKVTYTNFSNCKFEVVSRESKFRANFYSIV